MRNIVIAAMNIQKVERTKQAKNENSFRPIAAVELKIYRVCSSLVPIIPDLTVLSLWILIPPLILPGSISLMAYLRESCPYSPLFHLVYLGSSWGPWSTGCLIPPIFWQHAGIPSWSCYHSTTSPWLSKSWIWNCIFSWQLNTRASNSHFSVTVRTLQILLTITTK